METPSSDTLAESSHETALFKAVCFGRKQGDFSLGNLTNPEALESNQAFYLSVTEALEPLGIREALVPVMNKFNAELYSNGSDDFPIKISEEDRLVIRRPEKDHRAEGLLLPREPEIAIIMRSADCVTAILYNVETGDVLPVHAGRESLYDRDNLINGKPPRRYPSVIDAVMTTMENRWNPDDVHTMLLVGISADKFLHPLNHKDYGENNRRMIKHLQDMGDPHGIRVTAGDPVDGKIDQIALVRAQCMSYGIPPENIMHDGVCTYSDTDENGEYIWHSERRDPTPRNPDRTVKDGFVAKMNMIAVIRKK